MQGPFTLVFIAALLLPPSLGAQQAPRESPDTLSLAEATALARQNNPDFLARQNDLQAADWGVRAAYGALLPQLSASSSLGYTAPGEQRFGSVAWSGQPEHFSSHYSLSLSYSLSGAELLQPSRARAEARVLHQRVAGEAARLQADVEHRYLATLQAQEQLAQAERELARTAEHVQLAKARLEVGSGTPLEVKQAEVRQGKARIQLLQARAALATEQLALGQLLGAPISPSTHLDGRSFRLFEPAWEADGLVQAAMQKNSLLLAGRAQVEAAGTDVKVARSSYLPSVRVGVGLSGYDDRVGGVDDQLREGLLQMGAQYESCLRESKINRLIGETPLQCMNPSDPATEARLRQQLQSRNDGYPFDYERQPLSASLTVSLPIFTGFARQVRLEQAKAAADDARHQLRSQELRLRSDIATTLQTLQTAYQTALLQAEVRQAAAEELRLAQERFRFGATGSVEVTDAQTNLAEAEKAEIESVYRFHQSLAALEALVGAPLR